MKTKTIIVMLVVLGALMYLFTVITVDNVVGDVIENKAKPYEEMINKKVILDKDTLKVIDYSYIEDKIILSNGKEVALKYAQLNTVK